MSEARVDLRIETGRPVLNRPSVLARLAAAEAERDRARSLAARLEQIVHRDQELLWRVLDEPISRAAAEQLGFDIAAWLQETAMVSMGGASE